MIPKTFPGIVLSVVLRDLGTLSGAGPTFPPANSLSLS